MPRNNQTKSVSTGGPQELLDLIPRMGLLPGEIEADLEDLREAFLSELAPTTPYETAIVENIIALEWETHRHRGLRDNLIRSSFRKVAQDARRGNKDELFSFATSVSDEEERFANDLMSPTPSVSGALLPQSPRHLYLGRAAAQAVGGGPPRRCSASDRPIQFPRHTNTADLPLDRYPAGMVASGRISSHRTMGRCPQAEDQGHL